MNFIQTRWQPEKSTQQDGSSSPYAGTENMCANMKNTTYINHHSAPGNQILYLFRVMVQDSLSDSVNSLSRQPWRLLIITLAAID